MTMTIVEAARGVTGGVDTHLDVHVAAALDPLGALLGTERFDTDPAGYKALLTWLEGFGPLTKVGVEGTGSYGAGLARYLRRSDIEVIEVDRPNRAERRRSGKSDPLDAVEAARAALGGRAQSISKSKDGAIEAIRVLVVAKRSARGARIKALTQMRHLVIRFDKIANFHLARVTNGPTEALNNLIKRIKRIGFGFRNFENYRIRALLYAGKPNWRVLGSIVVR